MDDINAAVSDISTKMEYLTTENLNMEKSCHRDEENITLESTTPSLSHLSFNYELLQMLEKDYSNLNITPNVNSSPLYSSLVNDFLEMKKKNQNLQAVVLRLENETAKLESEIT